MSKAILPLILGLAQMRQKYGPGRGEDFTIPVDTKGMKRQAEEHQDQKDILSKRKMRKMKGKKNRKNRGRRR